MFKNKYLSKLLFYKKNSLLLAIKLQYNQEKYFNTIKKSIYLIKLKKKSYMICNL